MGIIDTEWKKTANSFIRQKGAKKIYKCDQHPENGEMTGPVTANHLRYQHNNLRMDGSKIIKGKARVIYTKKEKKQKNDQENRSKNDQEIDQNNENNDHENDQDIDQENYESDVEPTVRERPKSKPSSGNDDTPSITTTDNPKASELVDEIKDYLDQRKTEEMGDDPEAIAKTMIAQDIATRSTRIATNTHLLYYFEEMRRLKIIPPSWGFDVWIVNMSLFGILEYGVEAVVKFHKDKCKPDVLEVIQKSAEEWDAYEKAMVSEIEN